MKRKKLRLGKEKLAERVDNHWGVLTLYEIIVILPFERNRTLLCSLMLLCFIGKTARIP